MSFLSNLFKKITGSDSDDFDSILAKAVEKVETKVDALDNSISKMGASQKSVHAKIVQNSEPVQPKDDKELKEIIKNTIEKYGSNCDLNFIDVSLVTDMNFLFEKSTFNGDISKWDVSNVTNMSGMFSSSQFNGDISQWDVSNVESMDYMFIESQFNGDISKWNVSKVWNMFGMFMRSQFNGDISKWDVSNVTDMGGMFENSQFNGDISKWDVSNVTTMCGMFIRSQFNGDISQWNVSKVGSMAEMFKGSQFNGDISQWNVSKVSSMAEMFKGSLFNGDISKWDVSNVTNMSGMFENSQFNGDISQWDVSNVENFGKMFENSVFSGDISRWNISTTSSKTFMFYNSAISADVLESIVAKWAPKTFTDPRDGEVYKVVQIGGQIWMAENLRYDCSLDENGKCFVYGNDASNIPKYGRLYESFPKKACPPGWHLPTWKEWEQMMEFVKKHHNDVCSALRSVEWKNGEDAYGFAALPAGGKYYGSIGNDVGYEYFDIGRDTAFWVDDCRGGSGGVIASFNRGKEIELRPCEKKWEEWSVRCIMD